MLRNPGRLLALAAAVLLGTAAPAAAHTPWSVVASGLENPRGLTFGPDGALYVAEGGLGGSASTVGVCTQVPAAGPYTGGFGARISRIDRHGRTTVVDGLPTSQTNPMAGNFVSGVADVAFLGGRLYGMEGGAGCSHGLLGTHNSLFRVGKKGGTHEVADLSTYLIDHPVADDRYEEDDFEPDGTWYSMALLAGSFYATEPNHQVVERITRGGHITRVLDLSAESIRVGEWIGPTSIVAHDGDLWFGSLSPFLIQPGAARIYRLRPWGGLSLVATGLSAVLGIAWHDGVLYALESMTVANGPVTDQTGAGKVVRVNPNGSLTTAVDGLSYPAAMTFGPDGDLYISNLGYAPEPAPIAIGQVLRVDLGH
jgi:hypothetical protein